MNQELTAGDGVRSEIVEYRVLGVRASAMTIPQMNALVAEGVAKRERTIVVSQNLHSVYVYYRDPVLARVQESATHIRIDGAPIVYFGRWSGLPLRMEHRAGWMDWLDPFMEAAVANRWRIFYLGSKPGVAARGAEILRARFPGLQMETDHGYFSLDTESPEFKAVIERIEASAPDVLIVGMGMPRQEVFVDRAQGLLSAPVLLTSGAAIEYVAGEMRVPPRWLGAMGLEWAYRFFWEPRRLAKRYLVEPWFAVWLFIKERFSPRRP